MGKFKVNDLIKQPKYNGYFLIMAKQSNYYQMFHYPGGTPIEMNQSAVDNTAMLIGRNVKGEV